MLSRIGIYADDTTYSSLGKSGFFEVESADELELDVHSIA